MPCNSDYMNPNAAELNSKKTAQNLVYTLTSIGHTPAARYATAAEDYYGNPSILNEMTVLLCKTLRELEFTDAEKFEQLVYNGRNEQSRQLAAWWGEHDAADQARQAEELKSSNRKALVKSAESKLTQAEFQALKETWGG